MFRSWGIFLLPFLLLPSYKDAAILNNGAFRIEHGTPPPATNSDSDNDVPRSVPGFQPGTKSRGIKQPSKPSSGGCFQFLRFRKTPTVKRPAYPQNPPAPHMVFTPHFPDGTPYPLVPPNPDAPPHPGNNPYPPFLQYSAGSNSNPIHIQDASSISHGRQTTPIHPESPNRAASPNHPTSSNRLSSPTRPASPSQQKPSISRQTSSVNQAQQLLRTSRKKRSEKHPEEEVTNSEKVVTKESSKKKH